MIFILIKSNAMKEFRILFPRLLISFFLLYLFLLLFRCDYLSSSVQQTLWHSELVKSIRFTHMLSLSMRSRATYAYFIFGRFFNCCCTFLFPFDIQFNSIQFYYEGWYMFVNRSRNKSFFYIFHLFFWLVFLSFAVLLLRVWAEKR